ncbi:hypothetical protein [Ruminococcus flavefaciens]|uniref:hypothetical protein n=1 Tax=Ruminococcus flavefaciens TaxID=1265 RepID=UPI00048DE86D|nr:hypothetical protein [Ruminococcus flavefaciens]
MKEKNEFDILENAESSVTDRLEAEFPPRDNREKEKIFRMSERKFNNTSAPDTEKEQTVSGVEVYRRPKWQRGLSIAAACALVVGGATGGTYAFNRFRNTPAAESQLDTQKKVAPFGDFSELEYQLCDYNRDSMRTVTIEDSPEAYGYFELFSGPIISQQKRDKLADFFNNYDYEEIAADTDEAIGVVNEAVTEAETIDISTIEDAPAPINADESDPYFIYCRDNEIKAVKIYDVGEFGVLNYTHFNFDEQDGQYFMTDDEMSVEGYKIDYDLFKSTINEILSSEDEEETPTEPEYKGVAPFGNFSEHEYFIPGGEDAEKQIFVKADEETQITFGSGEVISAEQSKQIEELFNSLEWNESVEPKTKPFWLVGIDRMTFISMDGSDFNMLSLNGDNNTLTWDSFRYETESEYEGMATYKRTEGSARQIKTYDIDYISLVNKLSEIMGRDLGYSIHNDFINSDWFTGSDREILSEEQKKAIYELLSSCDFEQMSAPAITPQAYLVLFREENDGTLTALNIESHPDSTLFGCVHYEVDKNGQYNGSNGSVMWVGSCPDNTIEDKILKILGRSKLPEVITDLTANDWRFRDLDLNSENHLHYDVVDLNTKYTDGYDNSYLQMIYGTDSIPEDKLKLISDLLDSTAWYEIDYTEQHDLLFPDDNYDATQCIELSMMDDDHIFVMQLIEGENNTSLRIDAQSFFEENGTKYLDAPDDICLEVTDKILMCDDPELIDNIKRIIAG